MRKLLPWSMPLSMVGAALLQHGCAICTCTEEPGAGLPAAVAASAVSVNGSLTGNQPYAWKNVVVLGGGFVSGIIFSTVEKDLIYARTDVGGAYRWNPKDKTWIPLNDDLPRKSEYLGVESIALDPTDANKIYTANGTYVQSFAGYGAILRSNDRGNTWKITEMPIKMGGNEPGRSNGERLVVDPNMPSILFFGSRKNGLWKSADSAESFDQVKSFAAADGGNNNGIPIVLFDKASGKKGKPTPTLYAFVSNNEGGMYRSTDEGVTWKKVPGQPTGMMASHAEFDSTGTMYISYGNNIGPNDVTSGAVYKFSPKGDKFTDITPLAPKKDDGFGYGGLSVSQSQPGVVMVSTIDRWGPGDDVFRSTDGGKTWKGLFGKVVRDDDGAKYLQWHKPNEPYGRGWMGDIDIDPFNPARAMYITGQGIWGTEDAHHADADKPTHWKFLDRGLEETVIHQLVSPPAGVPLLSAMGDLCGFRHDDLDAPTSIGMFNNPICGSGTGIDVAWGKPDVVGRVGWPGYTDKQWGALSSDGGKTWTAFKSDPKTGKGAGAVAVSADGSTLIYAPLEGNVVLTRDSGATWVEAKGLPKAEKSPDWAPVPLRPAADRVNPKKFYLLDARNGQAYFSADGGESFAASPNGLPTMADYEYNGASIQATPGIEGHVWATTNKELNHSSDGGKTWDSIGGIDAAFNMGFGKAADGKDYPTLYLNGKIGDVQGLFRSEDKGKSWVRINDDQHQFGYVNTITGDMRTYGRVYIGTGGRGILYGDPKK